MGCGRVGSTLARTLEGAGHTVAIVDREEAAFRRLPPTFHGHRVVGVGFDRDTLVEAGIERADAFAAVSSGDNSNILAARVARETYSVEHVVARIYDPGRAQVYERLGIPTVATVRWAADQVMRKLVPSEASVVHQSPAGTVTIAQVPFHPGWVGQLYSTVESVGRTRVAYVSRMGAGIMMRPDLVHQEGDLVYLVSPTAERDAVERLFGSPPPQAPLDDSAAGSSAVRGL